MEKNLKTKKIIFLDRDGVINEKAPEGHYITKWKEFNFLPGSIEALQLLQRMNYQIFIVTNQAGVGKGIMSEQDLDYIHNRLLDFLDRRGVKIKKIYSCTHVKTAGCLCRKPQPGMLLSAANEFHFDLTKAVFVGDSETDILAAKAANCIPRLLCLEETLLDIVDLL